MQNRKILKFLGNLDLLAACVLVVWLICLSFVGVVRRYIFRDPIAWMEEVQMLSFLSVVFLGAAPHSGAAPTLPLRSWWMPCPKRSVSSSSGSMCCWSC